MPDDALAFAFVSEQRGPIRAWIGTPDCDAAHRFLLERLTTIVGGRFLEPGESLNERRKGNIGEFISWCVGQVGVYTEWVPFVANAYTPLSNISTNGIDIVWLFLPDSGPDDDHAVILEVKTTTAATTAYARTMTSDFEKLFGVDPAFTLQSRFQAIKNHLEFSHGRLDLCPRVEALAGLSPRDCSSVSLLPTVLHDLNSSSPDEDLLAVRTSIASKGWDEARITPWSIALRDLEARLTRFSQGQA